MLTPYNEPNKFKRLEPAVIDDIKSLADVADIIRGDKIDIIVFKNGEKLPHVSIKMNAVEPILKKHGIAIDQVACKYEGNPHILRVPTSMNVTMQVVTLDQIGLSVLDRLGIESQNSVAFLLPNFETQQARMGTKGIPEFVQKLHELNVEPSSIKRWARFQIETKRSSGKQSTYILFVNDDGLFEFEDCELNMANPKVIGQKISHFNSEGRFVSRDSTMMTSPVISMKEL